MRPQYGAAPLPARLGAGCACALFFLGVAPAVAGEPPPAAPPAEEAGLEEFTDDLIILKSDIGIEGKVIGETADAVKLEVDYGILMIPRAAIKRIEFNLLSRLKDLAEDDYAGRYRLAMRGIEMGMTGQAKGVLEGLAGKEGVPAEIYRILARLYESEGELKKALECWKKYAMSNPDDAEVKKRIAEIQKELGPEAGGNGEAGGGGGGEVAGVTEGIEASGWNVLPWGNPATARVEALDGNKVLMVQVEGGGGKDKAAVGRGVRLDLSGKSRLCFTGYNGLKAPPEIAVAIITSKDYFESRTIRVPTDWTELSVDLQAKNWKSKATDWTFKAEVEGLDSVRQIIILVYTGKQKALLYFDNIRTE